MSVFAVGSADIDELWQHLLPHVERFERETQLISAEDLRVELKNAEKQLWSYDDNGPVGFAVTQVYSTARGNICCIWAACGTAPMEQILEVFDAIEGWARGLGCVALEIRGRKGWKRVLPGFKETGILLEKCLAKPN